MNLAVEICGIKFKNPVMNASGTFGSGMEYSRFVELNCLGAIVTKGVAKVPWEGNPTPRVTETPSGMMNAIGLQNPGVDVFIERDLGFLEAFDVPVIVNVCGHSEEEYEAVLERLSEDRRVSMFEINVSCPNVKQGAIQFGTDPDMLTDITKKCKAKQKSKFSGARLPANDEPPSALISSRGGCRFTLRRAMYATVCTASCKAFPLLLASAAIFPPCSAARFPLCP